MKNKKILIVEDDKTMSYLLEQNLRSADYNVSISNDGETALMLFRKKPFDLCLIDVMLPRMDGFTLAKIIRKENENIPIIFLTARNMLQDKINGFKTGADDYVVKPFDIHELLYRIVAILRRTGQTDMEVIENKKIGNCHFKPMTRELIHGETVKTLSTKEAELLYMLIDNKNQILHRKFILQKIWGDDNFFNSRSMDVYLSRIRKLLSSDTQLELINIHGTGYRLVEKK